MAKIDIGPPDYRKNLPPVIKENYGQWRYHERVKPGVLKHVSESGAELYSIRVGSPRLVSVDFIRDICALADEFCEGYLRFTSRNNIEFLTADAAMVDPLIEACRPKDCRWAEPAIPSAISFIPRDGSTAIPRLPMLPAL
jgi:sulfite reductase beta subunit